MQSHAIRKHLIAATAFAGLVFAAPAAAAVTVLDFSGDACTSTCGSGGQIAASHGDGTGVDVSYASFLSPGGAVFAPNLRYWDVGYGDLVGVVWGGFGLTTSSRITLTALPGYEIALLSFDIATFLGTSAQSPVRIESLGGTGILSADVATLFPTHTLVTVNSAYFSDGIALNWGPDGFNVGLDNIAFDVRATGATGRVPESSTWALLVIGFGTVGSLVRRRRAQMA